MKEMDKITASILMSFVLALVGWNVLIMVGSCEPIEPQPRRMQGVIKLPKEVVFTCDDRNHDPNYSIAARDPNGWELFKNYKCYSKEVYPNKRIYQFRPEQ